MTVIGLLTDFGIKDGNVGVMKGVIAGINPDAQIVDLSHHISPQNIAEAALILSRSYAYFPPGTIFVAVVDPGVGTQRRPIAAQIGEYFFVAPDNGVLTLVYQSAERQNKPIKVIQLINPAYWLPLISHVFHGRDIFAPVGAHLSSGANLDDMGTPVDNPVRINFPQPEPISGGLRGEIIHIDHFGNISTNILQIHIAGVEKLTVQMDNTTIPGLVRTFGEREPGELVALLGSTGYLILAQVNGSAAQVLHPKIGDPVMVFFDNPSLKE
jgi:S-adenosyl-L-methionine hydrolase (adenosine-forming)